MITLAAVGCKRLLGRLSEALWRLYRPKNDEDTADDTSGTAYRGPLNRILVALIVDLDTEHGAALESISEPRAFRFEELARTVLVIEGTQPGTHAEPFDGSKGSVRPRHAIPMTASYVAAEVNIPSCSGLALKALSNLTYLARTNIPLNVGDRTIYQDSANGYCLQIHDDGLLAAIAR